MTISNIASKASGWSLLLSYFKFANSQITESQKPLAKALLALTFYLFTPIAIVTVIGGALIAIDQAIYPKNNVDIAFIEPNLSEKPLPEKGALLMKSIYVQLERELDSPLGWAPKRFVLSAVFR